MIRLINGFPFEVASPSYYRLALPCLIEKNAAIDVSFMGPEEWLLWMVWNGDVSSHVYKSRDEALGFVTKTFVEAQL